MMGKPVLLTRDGRTQNVSAWAKELGISKQALFQRLQKYPPAEALSEKQPARPGQKVLLTHNGKTACLAVWARHLGIPRSTLRNRLKKLPLAEALSPRKEAQ